MGSILEALPYASRVALIRLRSLGDCVLTTPALHILKSSRPDLCVAVMVEDRFRAIFEHNPDVELLLPPRLSALRRWRPRLCLNLHGGTRSAWMTALSGATRRAGFAHFRHPWVYNARIPRAQEILHVQRTVHTAEHLASAMFWLGAPAVEVPRARLYVDPAREPMAEGARNEGTQAAIAAQSEPRNGALNEGTQAASAAQFEPRNGAPAVPASHGQSPRPYAVIHAVAATPQKTWSPEGFLAVAARLREWDIDAVFIGTATDDLTPFRAYRTLTGAPLADIKSLLAGAALFVGNDSGPAHMAAAFGLPVTVIFGDSNPAIWSPWRTASQVVTAPGGIAQVAVAQVLDALTRLRVAA